MDNRDLARISLGVIIGALAAVAITKAGLTAQAGVLRWIAYCVLAGMFINTQEGVRPKVLMLAGAASALGLLVALCWMLFVGGGQLTLSGAVLSGQSILKPKALGFAVAVLAGLFFLSTISVFVAGLARPAVMDLLQQLPEIDIDKAKRIEALLRIVLTIFGVVALFLL
jgi:hypothetical protein